MVPLEEGEVSVTNVTIFDPIEHSGVEGLAKMISAYLSRVFSGRPQ